MAAGYALSKNGVWRSTTNNYRLTTKMSPNRRIFLNIIATYGRSLYALVIGLVFGRWTLMALGEVDYGLMKVE